MDYFAKAYKKAGIPVDFIWVDWEVDGPIEWNGAWESSKKCTRCREHIKHMEDFLGNAPSGIAGIGGTITMIGASITLTAAIGIDEEARAASACSNRREWVRRSSCAGSGPRR